MLSTIMTQEMPVGGIHRTANLAFNIVRPDETASNGDPHFLYHFGANSLVGGQRGGSVKLLEAKLAHLDIVNLFHVHEEVVASRVLDPADGAVLRRHSRRDAAAVLLLDVK